MEWHYGVTHVAYERSGQGPAVLLLHGWGDGKIRFEVFLNALRERGNEVIALDFPGHGSSTEPPEPWSVTEYSEMTLAFLDELGIEKCDVIAHSFGARVAIHMAANAPNRFDKLVLTGAAGLIPKRGPKYYFKVFSYKLAKRLGKIGWINKLFKIDDRTKNAGSSDYRALSGVMRPTFTRVVNQNLRPYLPKIKAPTLLVWGDQDEATPIWMGQVMEKEIPDSALIVFEGASHYAFVEQSRRFMAIIDSFLWK